MTSASLRLRLVVIILVPLLAIAVVVAAWQVRNARETAAELFDRSLLSTALAISADVARTGGNAISLETRDLLADTSGGEVFYNVFAPDGIYITGYATPPVPPPELLPQGDEIVYYNAVYHGQNVRVVRFRTVTTIDRVTGPFTQTVWQNLAVRNALVRALVERALIVITILIATVGLVVWFGVRIGLRPLLDLEDAIARRSSDDLSPIRRRSPPETRGLVQRLNTLFAQVEKAMEAQITLVTNAAHQLRNPLAGVLALAEAVESAPTEADMRIRAADLVVSARSASDLANKLLTLERVRAAPMGRERAAVDLCALMQGLADEATPRALGLGVALTATLPEEPVQSVADEIMLREAVSNLIDNALRHGGPELSRVELNLAAEDDCNRITVRDDGVGVADSDVEIVLSRFGQATPSQGSGLGLSIAEAVAQRHGGELTLADNAPGLVVTLSLPMTQVAAE